MAGRILIALSLLVCVGASGLQEAIKKLQADIDTIQKALDEEDAFLKESKERVDKLELLVNEAIADRNEASKLFSSSFVFVITPASTVYPKTTGNPKKYIEVLAYSRKILPL